MWGDGGITGMVEILVGKVVFWEKELVHEGRVWFWRWGRRGSGVRRFGSGERKGRIWWGEVWSWRAGRRGAGGELFGLGVRKNWFGGGKYGCKVTELGFLQDFSMIRCKML